MFGEQPWINREQRLRGTTMQQPGYIPQYHAEVNKGSVNMRFLTGRLNEMGQQGWRLPPSSNKTRTPSSCSSG
jgi:hypothetical protein